ncbi:Polyketide cyclase / dehydrase and lipid transport [Streptomyces sp. YIM 121038]|nr:Polyketide cyclase / dehydrase and lipid transport [Streptomyces sp. YIM 121038]
MSTIKETVDVQVPLSTAYGHWTQFEEFPKFMEGVDEVRQIDDVHNHWTTSIGGVRREFDTEIVDQMPDDRITWRTIGGDTQQQGSVRFRQLDATRTRVELVMDVEPTGVAEKGADALGMIERRVKGDLHRFKDHVERSGESGAWRGRIRPGDPGPIAGPGPVPGPGPAPGTGPGPVPGPGPGPGAGPGPGPGMPL